MDMLSRSHAKQQEPIEKHTKKCSRTPRQKHLQEITLLMHTCALFIFGSFCLHTRLTKKVSRWGTMGQWKEYPTKKNQQLSVNNGRDNVTKRSHPLHPDVHDEECFDKRPDRWRKLAHTRPSVKWKAVNQKLEQKNKEPAPTMPNK